MSTPTLVTLYVSNTPIGAGLTIDPQGDLISSTGSALIEIAKTSTGYANAATTLATFGASEPIQPVLFDSAGNLYGVTFAGGSDTVYELAKTATGYAASPTVLAPNSPANSFLRSLTTDSAGDLFAVAQNIPFQGAIIEVPRTASGFGAPVLLAGFDEINGGSPGLGLVVDSAGNLFGTTYSGGNGDGTIFELAKTASGYASTMTVLANFGPEGFAPYYGLVADKAGNLFGLTSAGGTHGYGTLFELAKTANGYAGTVTTLVDFDGTYGQTAGPLLMDSSGNLYGIIQGDGTTTHGAVYEIAKTADGYAATPTILAQFGSGILGPTGTLTMDAQGNLLGTTINDDRSAGTVFEVVLNGSAANPSASPSQAVDQAYAGTITQPIAISGTVADFTTALTGTAHGTSGLSILETAAAAGQIASISFTDAGVPPLTLTTQQVTEGSVLLKEISTNYSLVEAAGTVSGETISGFVSALGTTVQYNALSSSQVTITGSGDGHSFTVEYGGQTDNLDNIQALQFADHTEIVASTTNVQDGVISSAEIANLYAAVFAREPDVPGLAYYERAAINGTRGITYYAENFLSSPEYTGNPAHAYAQTPAGDAQFITDTYQNLLHRAPEAGAVSWYQTNVINPILASATPGTAAYTQAELLAHASVLADFSQTQEFIADVQVTAQHPADAQHYLVLI